MPFFEYKCADCGHTFTMLQARDAAREGHVCPSCSGHETARVFSTFASAVKGNSAAVSCPSAPPGGCRHAGSCGCGRPH